MSRSTEAHEAVPNGQLISDIEPILTQLTRILDTKRLYNRHVAPRIKGKKMLVRVGVNIQTINAVDEINRVICFH